MMILSDPIIQAINEQIAKEQAASLNYLALYIWCDHTGYDNAAAFYQKCAGEEVEHRDMFIAYLAGLDALPAVPDATPAEINPGSLEHSVEMALAQERAVTVAINQLYDQAYGVHDHMTCQFLLWFIEEQRTSLILWLRVSRWFMALQGDYAMIDDKFGELLEEKK